MSPRFTCLLHRSNEWIEWGCDSKHNPCNFQDTGSGINLCNPSGTWHCFWFSIWVHEAVLVFTCLFLTNRFCPMGQGTNMRIPPVGISIAILRSGIWEITIWWVQGSIQTTTYGPEQKHPYISSSTNWWTTMPLGEGFQKMSALVSNNTFKF